MTYLLIFLVITYCVIKYDICEYESGGDKWYRFIWIYLTIVSGLAYRLGGDGIVYVWEYPMYTVSDGFSWTALTAYNNRLPAWVILNKLCKLVTGDYWFFKLVHAIIINSLFGHYIKTYTRYVFSSTLFYFLLLYFDLNFQLLRQVLAIGFFLYGIRFYEENNWLKYYIVSVIAVLFHESAVITFVFPLMKLIKYNKKSMIILFALVIILFYAGNQLFNSILSSLPELFEGKAFIYKTDRESLSFVALLLNIILSSIIPIFVICCTEKVNVNYIGAIAYGLCYSIGCSVPIFYRFSMYFQLFFYVFYIDLFYSICTNVMLALKKNYAFFVSYFLIVFAFLTFRGRMYFSTYGDTGQPAWVQFYPYSSVIFKETYPNREQLFNKIE